MNFSKASLLLTTSLVALSAKTTVYHSNDRLSDAVEPDIAWFDDASQTSQPDRLGDGWGIFGDINVNFFKLPYGNPDNWQLLSMRPPNRLRKSFSSDNNTGAIWVTVKKGGPDLFKHQNSRVYHHDNGSVYVDKEKQFTYFSAFTKPHKLDNSISQSDRHCLKDTYLADSFSGWNIGLYDHDPDKDVKQV